MDKKFYLAIQISRDNKWYAYMWPVLEYVNVYAMLKDIPDVVSANIFATKTHARDVVMAWNENFKTNGVYMYDETF